MVIIQPCKFFVGQEVRILSKSVGVPINDVGTLIGTIGRVKALVPQTSTVPQVIYVDVGNDLLSFAVEDLEPVGFPQRSTFIRS